MNEQLQVIYLPIDKLLPDVENAKEHPVEQIEQIKKSITRFKMCDPIGITGEDNLILEGHGRYLALKALGVKEVPCIRLDHLKTKEERDAYSLIHNKLTMNSGFNVELLELKLDNIVDINMEEFGFELPEEETETREDDFEVNPPAKPKTKRGDIYQLGEHRLMCGDSTVLTEVECLMGGHKADMVFTDPPYDMDMGGQGCFKASTRNVKKRIDNIIHFDPYVLDYLPTLDIGSFYICTSKNGIPKYLEIFKNFNFNILFWAKTNPTPFTSGSFLPDIEYILYFSGKNRIWNNSLKPTEVYKKYYISSKLQGRKDAGKNDLHPTMKPIELISNKIRISSNKGGIVLDIFGGSGTTLMACEQNKRIAYLMELDPKYCDVIVERWEKFTGKKAVLVNA